MSQILNKFHISGTGSGDALNILTSSFSSVLSTINSMTSSQNIFKIRNYDSNNTTSVLDIVNNFAGCGLPGYSGDGGPLDLASFNDPYKVTIYKNEIYIVDCGNCVIRKIDVNGVLSTIIGNGSSGYSGDNGLAISATLNIPLDIVFDSKNNIYITDLNNHVIRKVDINGIITTVVGNGTSGYDGDGGLATLASIGYPRGMCIDSNDNLYITDQTHCVVRKIDKNNIITTIAGNGSSGYSGDNGLAILASFGISTSITIDDNHNLFIGDYTNNIIRKVNINNIITTISTSLPFNYIQHIKFNNGFLYVSDGLYMYIINMFDYTTKIIAGNGIDSPINDVIPTASGFNTIGGFDFDEIGNIYIADSGNNLIRKITISNLYLRKDNGNYLKYEKSNNLFSIKGDGVVNLNGNLQFNDINFLTQSYVTNSNMKGNINGFIAHNGYTINSPYFKGNEFSSNGSLFWMEPGYSKTWGVYSSLGDVKKLNSYITFSINSTLTYSVYPDINYLGLTYSDIFNISVLSNNNFVYPIINKFYYSDRIDVGIQTVGITSANITIIGRNINYFLI